jgi:hypothetical protein
VVGNEVGNVVENEAGRTVGRMGGNVVESEAESRDCNRCSQW